MNLNHRPPGVEAAQYAIAKALTGDDPVATEAFCRARGWDAATRVAKAAVSETTTGEFAAASAALTSGFIASLRQISVIGRLAPRRAPLNVRTLVGDGTVAGKVLNESEPSPAIEGSYSAVTLTPRRAQATVVVTREVIERGGALAEESLNAELLRALARAEDYGFLDPTNAGSVSFGAPTITSTGSALAAVDADLRSALQAAYDREISLERGAWVMHPQTCTYLAALRGSGGAPAYPNVAARGGTLLGLPVVTSTAIVRRGSPSERYVALVDPDEILFASDGAVTFERAADAAIEMSDTPSGGTASLRSLWQNQLLALRAQRWVAWHSVRPGGVVVIDAVSY